MSVVELDDRELLASRLRRNAAAHVYELGDLDDFDWPHTVWFGWESEGRLEDVALLYTQPGCPVLIAIADPPSGSMAELLAAITWSLPSVLYAHASPGLLETLGERYSVDDAAPHLKLALTQTNLIAQHALDGRDPHPGRSRRDLDVLRERLPGYVVRPQDARYRPVRRRAARRSARVRRRRPRLLADVAGCRARQRRHAAGAPWTGSREGRVRLALPAAPSTTGSRRSRSTSEPTTPQRLPRTPGSGSSRSPSTSRRAFGSRRRRVAPRLDVSDRRSGARVEAQHRHRDRRPAGPARPESRSTRRGCSGSPPPARSGRERGATTRCGRSHGTARRRRFGTIRLTWPHSSSSSMNTMPFAVEGRCLAIASPA